MSMLCETIHIDKKIGNKTIINDISIKIPKNSIYILAGPNGSGKSTLLKLLTKMLQPTNGQILFNNKPFECSDLIHIGSLIENPALYDNLTAEENLMVRSVLLGVKQEEVDKVLELFNLSNAKCKIVKYFSLGMRQSLGIAISLLHNPNFLILDEPTNGLDPLAIHHFKKIIKDFKKAGGTVLITTHNLKEVNDIADYMGIMVNGSLLCQKKVQLQENIEDIFMNTIKNNTQS